MNVIQRPRAEEFCATMQDYIYRYGFYHNFLCAVWR